MEGTTSGEDTASILGGYNLRRRHNFNSRRIQPQVKTQLQLAIPGRKVTQIEFAITRYSFPGISKICKKKI